MGGAARGVPRRRPAIRKIQAEERLRAEMMSLLEAAILKQSETVRASRAPSDPLEGNVFLTPLGLFDPPPPWADAPRDSDLPTLRVARYEPSLATLPLPTVRAPAVDPAKERETLPAPAMIAHRKRSGRVWLFALAMAAILGTGLAVDPQARDDVAAAARSAAARLWAALY